jgi:hypothetical protein
LVDLTCGGAFPAALSWAMICCNEGYPIDTSAPKSTSNIFTGTENRPLVVQPLAEHAADDVGTAARAGERRDIVRVGKGSIAPAVAGNIIAALPRSW